jgi:hypothetical protein
MTVTSCTIRRSAIENDDVRRLSVLLPICGKGSPQAIVQKMTKVVSGIRASLVLLTRGYIHEQAALCRTVDESREDISFLSLGMMYGETELHNQFFKEFYTLKNSRCHAELPRHVVLSPPDHSAVGSFVRQRDTRGSKLVSQCAVLPTMHGVGFVPSVAGHKNIKPERFDTSDVLAIV